MEQELAGGVAQDGAHAGRLAGGADGGDGQALGQGHKSSNSSSRLEAQAVVSTHTVTVVDMHKSNSA